MPKARTGFVLMKHEASEGEIVEVPRKSFDNHWSKKGWVKATEEEAQEAEEAKSKPLSDMTRDELNAEAERRGIDPNAYATKGELLAALES